MDRREFLKASPVVGTVGLAGCVDLFDDGDSEETSTQTQTPEPTPTPTPEPTPPDEPALTVETTSATDINDDGATLIGELTDFSGAETVTVGFEYRDPKATDQWSSTGMRAVEETGTFDAELSELPGGTEIEYRARGEIKTETARGAIDTFETTGRRVIHFDGGGTEALADAFDEAAKYPGSKIEIEPGVYQFDPAITTPVDGEQEGHIETHQLTDLIVEGQDSMLVFTDMSLGGLHFFDSTGVTIRDLTLDFDPLPFTQGEVLWIDEDTRELAIELEDGYPRLDEDFLLDATNWAMVHEPDGSFISGYKSQGSLAKEFSDIEVVTDSRYILKVHEHSNFIGLKSGRRLSIVSRRNSAHALRFIEVDQPTVEDVTIRTAGAFAMEFMHCVDPTATGVTVAPPPDSDRMVTTCADGIHFTSNRGEATITKCYLTRCLDDGIALQARMARVAEVSEDDLVHVESGSAQEYRPGDTIEAMTPTGIRSGELPEIIEVDEGQHTRTPDEPVTIRFAEPVTDRVNAGDYLSNLDTANTPFHIANNTIEDHRARLLQISGGPGLVENNHLSGSTHWTVMMRCDTRGVFAPKRWIEGVTIRDNTIERAGFTYFADQQPTGIRVFHAPDDDHETEGRPNRNIEIVDNEITTTASHGIAIEDAMDIEIKDNLITDPNEFEYPGFANVGISVVNAADVDVTDTTVHGSPHAVEHVGLAINSEGITSTGTARVIDGEAESSEVVTLSSFSLEFTDAINPEGSNRYLSYRVKDLELVDDAGDSILEVDIGHDESGISFGSGVYNIEEGGEDEGWRWLGGPAAVADIYLLKSNLEAASELHLRGYPMEEGISGSVVVGDESADAVAFGPRETDVHVLPFPS